MTIAEVSKMYDLTPIYQDTMKESDYFQVYQEMQVESVTMMKHHAKELNL